MGESKDRVPRLDFDPRLKLEFHGSKVTSDAGLLPYRELDDAVGLSEIAGDVLTDTRRGKNGLNQLPCWFDTETLAYFFETKYTARGYALRN